MFKDGIYQLIWRLKYQLDDRSSISGSETYLSLLHTVQIGSGAHPVSFKFVLATLSLEVKQERRESNNIHPCGAEAKNDGDILPLPPHVFIIKCLICNWKYRDKLIFTLSAYILSW
jgi:hypothetical protein